MVHRTLTDRSSGLLVHLSSLPGPHGCGDLGLPARTFVDALARGAQSWWQMLPVAPPGYGESPYSAQSAFAGNPLFVSLESLADDGLLDASTLAPSPELPAARFDAAATLEHRAKHLEAAFDRFRERGRDLAFDAFCDRASSWLPDFALFRALKQEHGGVAWTHWSADVKRRVPAALEQARRRLGREIEREKFVQYLFDEQWSLLREYAAERGVGLIGDVPLVVAHDSADVWQHRDLFFLDDEGEPTSVAGVPPDYFSTTGQRWGNPLYRWKHMKKDGYAWWTDRMRIMLHRFDAIRVDHFIGFQRYWRIPAEHPTAAHGRWMKGPGAALFTALDAALGHLPIIAEDLGAVTPAVFALRDRFGFPGIRLLQFAFGTDPQADNFLPHNYPRNTVVFTGTHDNDTTVGWFHDPGGESSTRTAEDTEAERGRARLYLGTRGDDIHWDMIRAALASVANVAMIPLQDVLGLGSETRMNRPGKASGNWTWRFEDDALSPEILQRLATLTRTYGRGGSR